MSAQYRICFEIPTGDTNLFDHGQNPGFVVIITVCPDAQVDLFVERILLVRGSELEDAKKSHPSIFPIESCWARLLPIRRRERDALPLFYGKSMNWTGGTVPAACLRSQTCGRRVVGVCWPLEVRQSTEDDEREEEGE